MEDLSRRQVVAFCALLFLFIALAYSNTLHSPLNFDDRMVIQTEIAKSGEQYLEPYPPRYRHLFYLSLAINYWQGKLNPLGYHLFNISLHYLTTLTLFFISYITIKRGTQWSQHAAPIAMITTFLFVLSPVHTETVTYISGRASGLSGLFYFSTLLLFILGSFSERIVGARIFCYLLSVLFFGAAVLSKETSLTLPAALLLYDFCFMNGEHWSYRKTRFCYFYLPLIVSAMFAVLSLQSMIVDWWQKIDFTYALQQTRIVGHGIYLLLFPVGLTFDYDFPTAFFPHPALCAWPVLLIALLIAGVAKFSPKVLKMVCFGVLWFLLTIAPTNSFLPRLDLLSERNLYIPSFGIFLLLATTFWRYRSKFGKAGIAGLAFIFIFQTALLVKRNSMYRSNTVLWEDTVKKAPGKTRAWNNLSHFYLMELNYKKAYDSLQGLTRSNPSQQDLAYAHSKLGVIHSRQGNLSSAIAAFEEGIRLNPLVPVNHLNLAGIYAKQKNYSKARDTYERAEQLFKGNPSWENISKKLYLNQAYILFKLKHYEQAETAAHKYMGKNPGSKSGHSMLGNIYAAMGRNAEATDEFAKATKSP
jgi:protein O-mannosyl-transferase